MQTIKVDGTTYTLKDNRDLVAFTKLAQTKFRKPVFKQSQREFPRFEATMSTRDYIERYQAMNKKHYLVKWNFDHDFNDIAAQYDPSIPLVEVFND